MNSTIPIIKTFNSFHINKKCIPRVDSAEKNNFPSCNQIDFTSNNITKISHVHENFQVVTAFPSDTANVIIQDKETNSICLVPHNKY